MAGKVVWPTLLLGINTDVRSSSKSLQFFFFFFFFFFHESPLCPSQYRIKRDLKGEDFQDMY